MHWGKLQHKKKKEKLPRRSSVSWQNLELAPSRMQVRKVIVSVNLLNLLVVILRLRRSQWPRGLWRRSSAARLLRSWVRIPPGAWMFVCCECCVLSGRGIRDGLITRPEESYRMWRVVVGDQETSKTRRLKPATRLWKIQPQRVVTPRKQTIVSLQYFYI